ncbi:50S ribosomal protein L23 [Candidatus Saccharibacteria bacterium]|nr:50S ribosomal protein L23 [Candidatus Saccharibacteria bacterium]
MEKTLTLKPRISEKAYGLSESINTYVFQVPVTANKQQVAQAVSAQFNVTVNTVNIANVVGKVKRTYRKGGRPVTGSRPNFKKAYVTLKEGDSITVFASEDDDKKNNKSGGKK